MSTIDVRLEPAWSLTLRADLIPIEKTVDDDVPRRGTPIPVTLTITRADERTTLDLDDGGADIAVTLEQATHLLRDVVTRTTLDALRQLHKQRAADDPPADGAR